MNIVFICGALETGKDGVGDYTRRLAGELIRQGHQASIIALNDRFLSTQQKELQTSDNQKIEVLRLPVILPDGIRFTEAGKYIQVCNPEWISLQYVPYSFHKKGFPLNLGKRLAKIGKGKFWHIMFHELWVGMDTRDSLKHHIYGKIQKHILKKTVQSLAPLAIHTQAPLYRQQLKNMGIVANILPLFGNIPVHYNNSKNNESIHLAFFGNIHYGANIEGFSSWIQEQANILHKIINIHFIGKNGPELAAWKNILDQKQLPHTVYDQQEAAIISKILSKASAGLTTTPFPLIEKSGAVAVMLEHHLPVICIARDWTPNVAIDPPEPERLVFKWTPDILLSAILNSHPQPVENVQTITGKFINSLKSSLWPA